jgi:hypothetical protein
MKAFKIVFFPIVQLTECSDKAEIWSFNIFAFLWIKKGSMAKKFAKIESLYTMLS